MLSIDQNCHIFWDSIAKCNALERKGFQVNHFIEDVDVAFTEIGVKDCAEPMTLACERFYRSGGADWGAALFYHEFLGTQPLDIRDMEPYTGLKTNVLAKKLETTVDALYDRYSPSDNHQLIGCSYADEKKIFHRTVGNLKAQDTAPFIREIIKIARDDLLKKFPSRKSHENINRLFETVLPTLCDSQNTLVDTYRGHFSQYTGPNTRIGYTSSLLACSRDNPNLELLNIFTRDYENTARLYNESITLTNQRLRLLNIKKGELPIFTVMNHPSGQVRTGVFLEGLRLRVADMEFPLENDRSIPFDKLRKAGVTALSGKAIVIVIQVRCGESGQPLALPYNGSLYMPAAHALAKKLTEHGYISEPLKPVYRVRFRLLDRIRRLDTPINLPDYLARFAGKNPIPADEFSEMWEEIISQANSRLEAFRIPENRQNWLRQNCPDQMLKIEQLDLKKRQIAEKDPKSTEVRELWTQIKHLSQETLRAIADRVCEDIHASQLEYWDSRGAIFPVCVALGKQAFYDYVVDNAEFFIDRGAEK